jgi:hypothetical protein
VNVLHEALEGWRAWHRQCCAADSEVIGLMRDAEEVERKEKKMTPGGGRTKLICQTPFKVTWDWLGFIRSINSSG